MSLSRRSASALPPAASKSAGGIAALGPDAAEAELTEFLVASRASIWRDEQSRAFNEWLADRPDLCELMS